MRSTVHRLDQHWLRDDQQTLSAGQKLGTSTLNAKEWHSRRRTMRTAKTGGGPCRNSSAASGLTARLIPIAGPSIRKTSTVGCCTVQYDARGQRTSRLRAPTTITRSRACGRSWRGGVGATDYGDVLSVIGESDVLRISPIFRLRRRHSKCRGWHRAQRREGRQVGGEIVGG
jgi:hypothetical protein